MSQPVEEKKIVFTSEKPPLAPRLARSNSVMSSVYDELRERIQTQHKRSQSVQVIGEKSSWEKIYALPIFSNDAKFNAAVAFASQELKKENLDLTTQKVYEMVRATKVLLNADFSLTIDFAVRRCLNEAAMQKLIRSDKKPDPSLIERILQNLA